MDSSTRWVISMARADFDSWSRDEVRAFDAEAIAAGVPGIVLMENAALGAAELLLSLGVAGPVSIVCGKGNNGGDGFVMARRLAMAGKAVTVELVANPDELRGDAATAIAPLRRLGVPVHVFHSANVESFERRLARSEWIVDALLGTGAAGGVRPPVDAIIRAINDASRKVLAVDLPSGLDADTGQPLGPVIHAEATATFLARKRGFDNPTSKSYTGTVYVLPIGVGKEAM